MPLEPAVEADHDRLIAEVLAALAVRLAGGSGGVAVATAVVTGSAAVDADTSGAGVLQSNAAIE